MIPDSRIHLLEKRLRTSLVEKKPNQVVEFTLLTVVNEVHNLANELWKDAHIFGPHQDSSNCPPPSNLESNRKLNQSISNSSSSSTNKRTSRSSELFADLDEEKKTRLEKLATLYSQSLDNNMSVCILSEVELWFQLLAENYDSSLSTFAPKDQIFSTVASRVYFVTRVFELQLTNILFYVDSSVLQAVLKNYPHRVPKSLRKQFEKLVSIQQENRKKSDLDQASYSHQLNNKDNSHKDERVTFQSETDGRSNFLNQNDFYAFCKQRDIFYSIKDIWTKHAKQKQQQFSTSFGSSSSNTFQQQQPHRLLTQSTTTGNFSSNTSTTSNTQNSKRINLRSPSNNNNSSNNTSTLDSGLSSVLQKIKQLIQLNSSPTNLSHLANLCLSQFVLDSLNYRNIGGLDTEDENLRQFFQSNPSKFKQLENRFPNPSRFNNDSLIFLKYFIETASWAEFNQHLIDRCIFEINQIDSSIERQEVRSAKDLIENLYKSRILAQVLGFLFFRPYRTAEAGVKTDGNSRFGKTLHSIEMETYMRKQIKLRSYHQPPIDLAEKIFEGVTQKKLIFTLPWIVDFLSQADSVTYQLPAYKKVISIFVQVYRRILTVNHSTTSYAATTTTPTTNIPIHSTENDITRSSTRKSSGSFILSRANVAFLRFYCGKLFKTDSFPTTMIFLNSSNNNNSIVNSNVSSESSKEDIKFKKLLDALTVEAETYNEKRASNTVELDHDDDIMIDSYNSIGDTLISFVFEKQMSELKSVLTVSSKSNTTTTNAGQNSTTINILPVRHTSSVRPSPSTITTKKIIPTIPIIECKTTLVKEQEKDTSSLQAQLESCFFQNHPPSVKRTVDFISDRIVSNFVKTVTTKIYPDFRTECVVKGFSGEQAVLACQEKIFKEFHGCLPKSEQAVDLLIGNSVSEGALLACKGICSHRSLDRIREWVNSHINKDLFPNISGTTTASTGNNNNIPLISTMTSPPLNTKQQPPQQQQQQQQSELNLQPKFQAIVKLQQCLQRIYKTKTVKHIDWTEFLAILKKDQLGNNNLIVSTTLDVVLSILTFCPNDFTQNIEDSFVSFWSEPQVWKSRITLKVLCPRNIVLFEQSNNPNVTWKKLSNLISRLIKCNVMGLPELEEQCLEFLRHEWHPSTLKRISEFSKHISSVNAPSRTQESEIIDWIAWACSDDAEF